MSATVPHAELTRRDIQGLRALAVVAVVIYHFWPGRLTGGFVGVDVFFVISGYLITDHLLRKPPTSPRLLAAFWARRVRRLLPAATLVLLATLAASIVWAPRTMLIGIAREAGAAALYGENWYLAITNSDYLAAHETASPVRHYWSLSVEEQFYIIWPLLLAALTLVGAKLGRPKQVLLAGLLLVTGSSLVLSVWITSTQPDLAYYATHVRMWELALGGVVAWLARYAPAPGGSWVRPARVLGAYGGVVLMVAAMSTFDASTPFPSWWALIPCGGAALVMLTAADGLPGSPDWVWRRRPVQWLGDVSYSIYLWHWPVVVLAPYALGRPNGQQPWVVMVGLIAGIALAAGLTKVFVEEKLRYQQGLVRTLSRSFAMGAALITMVVLSGAIVVGHVQAQQQRDRERVASGVHQQCFGAASRRDPACQSQDVPLVTTPLFAKKDMPQVWPDHCWNDKPFTSHKRCTYGPADAPVKVALLGNSHIANWFPAIRQVAQERGWLVHTYLIPECYTVTTVRIHWDQAGLSAACQAWNRWALDTIAQGGYSLVVMANRTFQPLEDVPAVDKTHAAQEAYAETLRTVTASTPKVLIFRDTPAFTHMIPDCVQAHLEDPSACDRPRQEAVEPDPLAQAGRLDSSGRVRVEDLNDLLCSSTTCPAVIGGVIAYFDNNHLTATYTTTMVAEVRTALDHALG